MTGLAALLSAAVLAGPPPPSPDPSPGAVRPATVDSRPYLLMAQAFDASGRPVPGLRLPLVIGRPNGYAPAGVTYRP